MFPRRSRGETLVLPLDDEAAFTALLRPRGDEIAAVIIEPVPANNGLLLQRPEFLAALRRETERAGALLIFDEVISGFRLAQGGAAELLGITPDLATFGKVIGGGLPVGAFGGRRDIMRMLAPEGPVYQAGTLSGNAAAMAAGLATLNVLEREDGWRQLEATGAALEAMLAPVLAAAPEPAALVRAGSLFWISLQAGAAPRAAERIDGAAAARYAPIFHALLDARHRARAVRVRGGVPLARAHARASRATARRARGRAGRSRGGAARVSARRPRSAAPAACRCGFLVLLTLHHRSSAGGSWTRCATRAPCSRRRNRRIDPRQRRRARAPALGPQLARTERRVPRAHDQRRLLDDRRVADRAR